MLLSRRFLMGSVARQDESEVDITPMLDVVFILLIFFIVTASFVRESGFGLYAPPEQSTINKPHQIPIVLEVGELGDITVQRNQILPSAIKAVIVRLRVENPEAPIMVRLHPRAKTKAMVAAIDGVRSANVLLPSVSLSEL